MKGFDQAAAAKFILQRLDKNDFKPLGSEAQNLVRQAIGWDLEYMRSAGVIDENGLMGAVYYDDDDAFEYILERMGRERGLSEDDQGPLASFIDQYMDLLQQYLESAGLLEWD